MTDLQLNLQSFCAPTYTKTPRTTESYIQVTEYCSTNLIRLIATYHLPGQHAQTLREIRNDIDHYVRRYHQYCIQQRDGMQAHYHQRDLNEAADFEHLIPASKIRDMLLAGALTITQALNSPTVRLSRVLHAALARSGWGHTTPNMWLPFQRYHQLFDAVFETCDGTVIDPDTWTLQQHYQHHEHLMW